MRHTGHVCHHDRYPDAAFFIISVPLSFLLLSITVLSKTIPQSGICDRYCGNSRIWNRYKCASRSAPITHSALACTQHLPCPPDSDDPMRMQHSVPHGKAAEMQIPPTRNQLLPPSTKPTPS